MALQIGDTAPDFEAESTEGTIRPHDWIGHPDGWESPRPYIRVVPQPR
jgi:thioredoxin-dependent peroxiredoxin